MVKTICLLLGSFLVLQAHGTSAQGGPLCDVHEEPSDCYGNCQATCSVRNPRCTRDCSPGCVCQSGFIREFENGECIRKEKCRGCNGDPNAETGCDTCNTNCDNYDIEPKMCSKRACRQDECKCIDGFVKNSNGLCIPYEKCPPACGLYEEYSACNGHCQKTCKNKNPICTKVCKPGCVCQPGYIRDDKTNECIKEDQCPSSCGINEVYSPCSGHCQKTCKNKNPICPLFCRPGCICRPNYVRDIDNKCTKENRCPILCDINEVHSRCSKHCENKARNLNRNCTAVCRPACICRPNYVRDVKTKKCIKKNRCPNIKCGVNEEPTKCLPGCPEDTCEKAGKKKSVCNTLLPVPCKAGCICRENYFRNADGVCTSADDCLKCQKPNEVFGCRGACDDKKCATLTEPCNIFTRICIKKCYCRKGYVRNRCGLCIPISECPKKPVRCPVNEEYKCVMPCPPNLCRTRFAQFKCRGDQVCVSKCECKAGYLRNNKGRCVKRNQCEKPKCGKNEVFACHITCPPKTCRSMVERIICPKHNPCRERCDCKDNYLRNNDGICIPSKQCFPSLNVPIDEPNTDNAAPPNETDETSEPDTGDALPPADDDIYDDDDD